MRFLSIEPLLEDLGVLNLAGIDWVIVGGESGPGARPMQAEWVEAIREQCEKQGAKFFFKQWGGVQKGRAGRQLNGRTYDDMPAKTSFGIPAKSERDGLARELAPLAEGWLSAIS